MLDDPATFAPFVLLEYPHAPGTYCLILTDEQMEEVAERFEEAEAEGNGHDWEALAEAVVQTREPGLADDLSFTSESGTFAVNSTNLDALRRLASILHSAYHDEALLSALLRGPDPLA
ncbi:immunity 51 family protein [Micromonospora gifhornensis]|uniref:immunity 51 family protein n=1 Tax=Micromonospora gifhornensis TaxID=84594 RepID=UPI0034549778